MPRDVNPVGLADIEKQTRTFAEHQRDLRFLVEALQAEVEHAKRRAMKKIRNAVERAANSRAGLKALIEQRPDLFVKPRSVVIDGIKVGFQKAKGGLVIDDEKRTCELIHLYFPSEVEQLIVATEKPVKSELNLLTAADLRRIGVKVTNDTDEVLIKDTASDVDKLVAALLKEETE